jgi:fibronectin-binding autotransporter adhesin
MCPKHLITLLVLLTLAVPAAPAQADGIVSVCDEAHLLAALAGGGTVTFSCSGTITLAATITIAADTTIDGSGQTVTISGNHALRVFTVNSGVTLNLNKLTVADGNSAALDGGGIYNSGTLTVSNSTFDGNSAALNGGGIYNSGTLTVGNSAFSNNSANWAGGGGIYNSGMLTVSNSTFSSNSATYYGGGIWSYTGTLTVSNSTFSANSASESGGGIRNSGGTVTLQNTIVANNPTGSNCSGAITDGGGNLSYPDATCPGLNSDPTLGPLQNNGGPTKTIALLPGSAAIDAANDAICAAAPVNNRDQRGIIRPQGSHCDIGAYEAIPSSVVSICDEAHLLAAVAGGGTVTFTCSGTITLTAEITIVADTTIDGGGQSVTISGKHAVRVFSVNSGITLDLNELTVADGSAFNGGGIANHGTLTVSNSTFSGNSAGYVGGGISNGDGSTLTVSNSTFFGNHADIYGGGIYNSLGTVVVSNSTFDGNSARSSYPSPNFGGGIFNSGTLTVSNSTFDDNSAARGGGIHNDSGTMTVNNSTFSRNSAYDGGGGIYNFNSGGAVTMLKNTIVANSPMGGNCSGTITDDGGNLSYPDTTCPGINSDPVLGPLQDNGGPTHTMALLPGSAALDAANDAICAAAPVNNRDQRGIARPQGPHCDIGAYEAMPRAIVSICDEAHLLAALADGGTVTFSCSGTITLTATITIAADTTIDGSGQTVTISGNHALGVFTVNSRNTLNLNKLTVADGSAFNGGGIYNSGTFNVDNSSFSGNGGGGINNNYGTVTVNTSTFTRNGGGGINNNYGTVTVNNSTFAGNSAYGGGGISNSIGTVTVSNSTFAGNSAGGGAGGGGGGGIGNWGGTLTVSNSTFAGNSTSEGIGGGIDNYGGTATVNNSTFSDNSVSNGRGGGIATVGTLIVSSSAFSGNSASGQYGGGGGIYITGAATAVVNDSTFAGNRASGQQGGGIYNDNGTLAVSNSTFSANSAGSGGGIDNGGGISNAGTVTVINSTFSGNSASTGGGIRNSAGALTLKNTIVANSPAGGNCSGAIADGGGNLTYPDATCPGIKGNPVLGPLQNNGGPTRTMALGPGSAARDAANDAICEEAPVNNLDQRGITRPQGPHCDIGAYEALPPRAFLPMIMR